MHTVYKTVTIQIYVNAVFKTFRHRFYQTFPKKIFKYMNNFDSMSLKNGVVTNITINIK